ncbi:hypothetical protein CJ195_05395 [Bacillus sp. UMB0899]|uniref:hypothetical protein n=1 Tax=Metabacillus schmidteae TaxID=2730405 RepID=UPI000C7FEB93|nr:hypothetical protein [Metabacillus schmidteae]PMC39361.1 hypothetical protein CJ195_05395 [Bacillus sp. UMB0899]
MKDHEKVRSISEYQLMKQLKEEKHELVEVSDLSELSDPIQTQNAINDEEKQQIQTTVKNMSQLCGWVLYDHVVMRNCIKLIFVHPDYSENKEIVIQTDDQNRLLITADEEGYF